MARREVAQALTRVMERNYEVVVIEGSLMQVVYQEARDSVTFSNKDLVNWAIDGNRPLYVTAFLGASWIKRELVDIGASTNILPLPTFDDLGISKEWIIPEPMQGAGIGALQQNTLGHVSLDHRVGPIHATTLMYVMEGNTSYHIILGHP